MKRREFLRTGLSGLTAFSITGLLSSLPASVGAANLTLNFVAEAVNKTLIDGSVVPVWQYRDEGGGSGPGMLASAIVVRAGDTVTVNLRNALSRNVNFDIPGIAVNSLAVAPGQTRSYTFTAPGPGSFSYGDQVSGEIGRAMGLAGPLIILPADGSNRLNNGGPLYAQQFLLFLQELDTRLNAAISAGQSYAISAYEPNYFFVNGLSYPDTTADASTGLQMAVGQRVAFRIINGGLIFNPLHFHGYHVQVVNRNRQTEQFVVNKDTVSVRPQEAVDVLLNVNQSGRYPLHSHYLPAVTANGVYANGALLIMNAV